MTHLCKVQEITGPPMEGRKHFKIMYLISSYYLEYSELNTIREKSQITKLIKETKDLKDIFQ